MAQSVEQLIRNQQVAGPNPATSSKLLKLTKASQSGAFCLLFAICRFSPFALFAPKTSDMQLMLSFRAPCDGDAPVFGVGGRFGIGDLPINNTKFFQNRIVLRTKCSRFESGQLQIAQIDKGIAKRCFLSFIRNLSLFPFRPLRSQNERHATHAVIPRAVRWGCPCFLMQTSIFYSIQIRVWVQPTLNY